jgi:hypothetical protein
MEGCPEIQAAQDVKQAIASASQRGNSTLILCKQYQNSLEHETH